MKPEVYLTKDGTHTLFIPELDETYHSRNGALSESMHIFINSGLKQSDKDQVCIFEMGFGTGLNALLTYIESQKMGIIIDYLALELYPLSPESITALNYPELIGNNKFADAFLNLHQLPWEERHEINSHFFLEKKQEDIRHVVHQKKYDLVYFDAFAPDKQPELWTRTVFSSIINNMNKGGIITTYTAKGAIRRIWQDLGLTVEKRPGPPGKREFLYGVK
jgi:tRNA U34 5-methylaminomethyl-2-thiouridine-forming methyltransferase MnmC